FAANIESLADAALFNVDDPLGDVLDEGPAATAAPEAPTAISAPVETFDNRFAVAAPLAAAETPVVEAAAQAEAPADYEVELPGRPRRETRAPAAESVFSLDMPTNMAPSEPAPADETGFGFTPAVDKAEPVDRAAQATEVKFTTASMWTDEDARFAAI